MWWSMVVGVRAASESHRRQTREIVTRVRLFDRRRGPRLSPSAGLVYKRAESTHIDGRVK